MKLLNYLLATMQGIPTPTGRGGFYIGGTTPNKYTPHQGTKECARRRKQMLTQEYSYKGTKR